MHCSSLVHAFTNEPYCKVLPKYYTVLFGHVTVAMPCF